MVGKFRLDTEVYLNLGLCNVYNKKTYAFIKERNIIAHDSYHVFSSPIRIVEE